MVVPQAVAEIKRCFSAGNQLVTVYVVGSFSDTTGPIWDSYIQSDLSEPDSDDSTTSKGTEEEADAGEANEVLYKAARINVVTFSFELSGRSRRSTLGTPEIVARVYEPVEHIGDGLAPDRLNLTKCLLEYSGASKVKVLYGSHAAVSDMTAVNCLDVAAYAARYPQLYLQHTGWGQRNVTLSQFVRKG